MKNSLVLLFQGKTSNSACIPCNKMLKAIVKIQVFLDMLAISIKEDNELFLLAIYAWVFLNYQQKKFE